MCATLTRDSPREGIPTYSSMSFGLVPAASTRTGAEMSLGTLRTVVDRAGRVAAMLRRLLSVAVATTLLLAVPAQAQDTVTVDLPATFAAKIDRIAARGKGPVL